MTSNNLPLLLLLPLALILVVLWGVIKNVIRNNGYPSDPLREHTRDIANLHDLATWEKNPTRKTRFTILLAVFYITLFAMVISFFVYLVSYLQQ